MSVRGLIVEDSIKEKNRAEFLDGFKYLERDFVEEVTDRHQPSFTPVKYSENFSKFTQELGEIRKAYEANSIDIHEAFKLASEAEEKHGYEPKLSLGADKKIDASGHVKAFGKEIDELKFYPDYPSHADNGEKSAARSELRNRKHREAVKAESYFTLKPFVYYRVDEAKMKSEVREGLEKSFYHVLSDDDRKALIGFRGTVDFNDIVNQVVAVVKEPLARRGVIVEPKPKQG